MSRKLALGLALMLPGCLMLLIGLGFMIYYFPFIALGVLIGSALLAGAKIVGDELL